MAHTEKVFHKTLPSQDITQCLVRGDGENRQGRPRAFFFNNFLSIKNCWWPKKVMVILMDK
jgi:hypothetical protein